MHRFYFAGKVRRNCWRHKIVDHLDRGDDCLTWPILRRSVFARHDYVGPFFMSRGGHGQCHGEFTHGNAVNSGGLFRGQCVTACINAIGKCTVVFAWIETLDCYGTLAELGYAKAIGKEVWIGIEKSLEPEHEVFGYDRIDHAHFEPSENTAADLWFVRTMAHQEGYFASPREALVDFLYDRSESPIEAMFWKHAKGLPGIVQQYPVNGYRLDFTFPQRRVAVELDGHMYHKSRVARTRDAKRDRDLARLGWKVLRFTGSEVYQDVTRCVAEVRDIIAGR